MYLVICSWTRIRLENVLKVSIGKQLQEFLRKLCSEQMAGSAITSLENDRECFHCDIARQISRHPCIVTILWYTAAYGDQAVA
jgi:hypothetical protein